MQSKSAVMVAAVLEPAVAAIPQSEPASPGDEPLTSGDTSRMLETLLGNLDGMVYRCRDDVEWTMEFVSEGCARVTGYRPGDLLLNDRVSYEEITHPDDRARVRNAIHAALAKGERFDLEYRIRHADGTLRWVWERGVGIVDEAGNVAVLEGLIEDITERVAAADALREAERRYRSLFDNAIEGIFRTTPDGHYLDANPALARIYGFDSPAELVAMLQDIRTQLYVDPRRREEFMTVIKARGAISNFESQIRR
jgi:PAS domain S-box-containing protein